MQQGRTLPPAMFTQGAELTGREIGLARPRLEDIRFIKGEGRYVDDLNVDGQLYGHVVRAPIAHADILSIDTSTAAQVEGVVAIFTYADLKRENIGTLPCEVEAALKIKIVLPPRPALADGRVRHVGDPVAFVVAASAEAARDAAELVHVEYRQLPVAVDLMAAVAPDAPLVWPQAPENISFRFEKGDAAAVKAAFERAVLSVELEISNNKIVAAPLEPRGAIGSYDDKTSCFDLVVSGQGVHDMRRQLAQHVFQVDEELIQMRAPDVGGGFGAKNVLYPEWVLLLFAARRLRRPVKWISDRSEDFITSVHGRANKTRARLALDAGGNFLALHVDTLADMGAYLSALGPLIPTYAAGTVMGGVYNIPAIFMDVRGVFTNTVPIDAYRGAGKPEANYVIERLIDLAARRMGVHSTELRRRNIIKNFPHKSALGMMIEKGAFESNIELAVVHADLAGFEARRAEAASRGRLRGLGFACFMETARGQPSEWAAIRFADDGQIELAVGTQSNGQGHETSFPQIAADLLALPIERFRFVQADTRQVRAGGGHGGARSIYQGGAALVKAIEKMLDKARSIAGHLLQSDPAILVFAGGYFSANNHSRVHILEIAEVARTAESLPAGMTPGLDCEVTNQQDLVTFPNGCHAAEVEIDPDTGVVELLRYIAVDDFGRLINPLLTEGQVMGGLAQGISQALYEDTIYDPDTGQLLSGSFMDYCLPRASDLPGIEVHFNSVPSISSSLGVKGSGQAGCIAGPQTIINAVLDALAKIGVESIDMPATPARIWAAIHSRQRAQE